LLIFTAFFLLSLVSIFNLMVQDPDLGGSFILSALILLLLAGIAFAFGTIFLFFAKVGEVPNQPGFAPVCGYCGLEIKPGDEAILRIQSTWWPAFFGIKRIHRSCYFENFLNSLMWIGILFVVLFIMQETSLSMLSIPFLILWSAANLLFNRKRILDKRKATLEQQTQKQRENN